MRAGESQPMRSRTAPIAIALSGASRQVRAAACCAAPRASWSWTTWTGTNGTTRPTISVGSASPATRDSGSERQGWAKEGGPASSTPARKPWRSTSRPSLHTGAARTMKAERPSTKLPRPGAASSLRKSGDDGGSTGRTAAVNGKGASELQARIPATRQEPTAGQIRAVLMVVPKKPLKIVKNRKAHAGTTVEYRQAPSKIGMKNRQKNRQKSFLEG